MFTAYQKSRVPFLGGPHIKDYSSMGSTVGSPTSETIGFWLGRVKVWVLGGLGVKGSS